jgi:DNA-binding MarR family transcriptional regulator
MYARPLDCEDPALFEAKARELRLEIDRIAERIKRVDAACLGTIDLEISPQELRYVEVLGGFESSCMMRELADRANVAVSTATGVVDKLVLKGLAHRERVDEDRRVVRVALSDKGRAVHDAIVEMHMTFSREMLAALNPDEREILLVLMRKIARNAGRTEASQKTARPGGLVVE